MLILWGNQISYNEIGNLLKTLIYSDPTICIEMELFKDSPWITDMIQDKLEAIRLTAHTKTLGNWNNTNDVACLKLVQPMSLYMLAPKNANTV